MASITKRTTSRGPRYDVRYRDPIGRVRTRTFQRKIDAGRFADHVETDIDRGQWTDPRLGEERLDAYSTRWLASKPSLRTLTRDDYRALLGKHIIPAFGDTPLNRITTEAVRAWHAQVQSATGIARAAKAYRLLRSILNTATDDGLISRNPCRVRGAGQERAAERPLITTDQVHDLLEAIPDEFRALVMLAAGCGLRLGEILAVRRRDVDLFRGVVTVERQCQERSDGTVFFAPPKTTAGVHMVAIPASIAPVIEAHLSRFAVEGPDGLLFAGRHGAPRRRKTVYRAWSTARTAAGLDKLHIHDLRHCSATLAAQAGATTKELMARLGHSTPRAALIYQHAAADRDREVADRLGDLIGATRARRDAQVIELAGPATARSTRLLRPKPLA